jgi:hypothetical protein
MKPPARVTQSTTTRLSGATMGEQAFDSLGAGMLAELGRESPADAPALPLVVDDDRHLPAPGSFAK